MTIEYGALLMGLFGGLGLFLFGMDQLTSALKSVAGSRMKAFLSRMTRNRFKAAFAGAFVTSVIQSSSVTTVLVVGFISAGLLTLTQSIGVIMGANVGTTITAQIIAFKVTQYSLILVALGTGAYLFSKKEQVKQLGMVFLGLGLIFFGMDMMGEATRPLRSFEPFVDAMRTMDSPFYGILIAAAFTGIVQSSSATTGVIIVLATQGFISLEAGIALVFGANIGTCVTALLASIGKEAEAVRASAVHVLFNVLGVVIWFAFIEELAFMAVSVSPSDANLVGIEKLAAETPRQIANAHTIFNVANTIIFIGLVTPIGKLVEFLIPKRVRVESPVLETKYLDEILLDTPDLALDRVQMELQRVGERAIHMVEKAVPLAVKGTAQELRSLARLDEEVDALHRQILAYLGALTTTHLKKRQSRLANLYLSSNNSLEAIGDIVETNLVQAGIDRAESGAVFSQASVDKIRKLHSMVLENLEKTLNSVTSLDVEAATDVINSKLLISDTATALEAHLARRLTADKSQRVVVFGLESEIVEYLKRVYYFSKRIAKEVIAVDEAIQNQKKKKQKKKAAKKEAAS